MKANPQVYRDAAERVFNEVTEFSCCAISHAAPLSCDRKTNPLWQHRRLYQQCMDHEGCDDLLDAFMDAHNGDDEIGHHRIFALLFCAEWCEGMELP